MSDSSPIIRSARQKPKLLLANDDPFLLFAYQSQLETYFKVDVAENGYKATEIACSKPKDYYQAIILDINMPIMNGFEACELIYNFLNDLGI